MMNSCIFQLKGADGIKQIIESSKSNPQSWIFQGVQDARMKIGGDRGSFSKNADGSYSLSQNDRVFLAIESADIGGLSGLNQLVNSARGFMRNPSTQFKVVDGAGKNVATNFTTPQNADNFITYFQRHPDEVSKLNGSDSNGGTSGGGSGGNGGSGGGVNPGGNGGGTVTPGADEVAGIKIPYKTTGKVRVDDWHYNANDGLRADFEGNPKDGSFTNNVAVFYGTFVGPITTKEDRAVKWSWARHTGSGTRVNTYIVNIRNGDGATRSRMEVDHPNGYETMVDWGDHEAKGNAAKTGQLWGIMGVRRNVVGAADGKVKAVRLELYEDQGIVDNKPGNQWVKLLQHDDTKYLTTTYPNGMEVTGRFDDDKGDKNIKISKALIAEVDPQKA